MFLIDNHIGKPRDNPWATIHPLYFFGPRCAFIPGLLAMTTLSAPSASARQDSAKRLTKTERMGLIRAQLPMECNSSAFNQTVLTLKRVVEKVKSL